MPRLQDIDRAGLVLSSNEDADLVRRALGRDGAAVRSLIQKYNKRLYRLARSIVRDDGVAEDVVQEAYMKAFSHLESFRGESSLATWLSRIAINEALQSLRHRHAAVELEARTEAEIIQFPSTARSEDPERTMAQREILHLVERATDNLPEEFRLVFVTRVIEGMSVQDTADILGIRSETVKTRLHRARRLIREQLDKQIGPVLMEAFPFAGRRCDRLTAAVMERLAISC